MSSNNRFNVLSTSADQRSKYQPATKNNRGAVRPKSQIKSVADHPGYKTEMCKYWEQYGNCNKGFCCGYAHGKAQLRKKQEKPQYIPKPLDPELYKTQMCKWIVQNGHCTRGERCAFAHNEEELTFHRHGEIKPAPPMTIAQQVGLLPEGWTRTISVPMEELAAKAPSQEEFDLTTADFPDLPANEVFEAINESSESPVPTQSKSWAELAEECC